MEISLTDMPNKGTLRKWHCRYGHFNHIYLNQLINKQLVEGLEHSDTTFDGQCEACASGKMSRIPFPTKSAHRATELFETIHSDVEQFTVDQ